MIVRLSRCRLVLMSLVIAVNLAIAIPPAVTAGPGESGDSSAAPGPPPAFMPDVNRQATYAAAPPDKVCPIPTLPVTRDTYFKWLEFSRHFAYADHADTHGEFGPRHYLPVLAKYVQSGDAKYGQACLRMIEQFDGVVRQKVAADGWHEIFGAELPYLAVYRRYLVAGGLLKRDDPRFRETAVNFARTLHPWATSVTLWRGPMHRAQGEGVTRSLVSRWYPDIPEAAEWQEYSAAVYQDWWRFRDFPHNDTGYLFVTLMPLFLHAWLTDNDAFFTDPAMKPLWDRLVHEVSPDGSIPPYGAHGGWNSTAGTRIALLEMLAAKTRDGSYRFVAHRLMNYLVYQRARYRDDHILLGPESTEPLSLAYLFADDSVVPRSPSAASRILARKETLRFAAFDKPGPAQFLGPLDENPDRNVVDCGLIVTDVTKPSKLILRSGWDPGDFFVLVDLFPRHDPLNCPGILGMTRWGAALAGTVSAKDRSDENRVIVKLVNESSGPVNRPAPETEVLAFEDSPLATFATVRVTNYDSSPLTCTRHFLFVKNRALLVRDELSAPATTHVNLATVFNTQNVGPATNAHAALTYVSQPIGASTGLLNPAVDLLVFQLPRPGAALRVIDRMAADRRAAAMPVQLRYEWEGELRPDAPFHFATLFHPQPPSSGPRVGTNAFEPQDPGRIPLDTRGVEAVRDDERATVIKLPVQGDQNSSALLVINPTGHVLNDAGLKTSARAGVVIEGPSGKVTQWGFGGKPLQFERVRASAALQRTGKDQ